jgi:hypothetical protein
MMINVQLVSDRAPCNMSLTSHIYMIYYDISIRWFYTCFVCEHKLAYFKYIPSIINVLKERGEIT